MRIVRAFMSLTGNSKNVLIRKDSCGHLLAFDNLRLPKGNEQGSNLNLGNRSVGQFGGVVSAGSRQMLFCFDSFDEQNVGYVEYRARLRAAPPASAAMISSLRPNAVDLMQNPVAGTRARYH